MSKVAARDSNLSVCAVLFTSLLCAFPSLAQTPTNPLQNWPAPQGGDYVVHDFHFQSGETLPEIRLHYYTLGKPKSSGGFSSSRGQNTGPAS
jgi:hypothetical protein